MYKYRDKKRRFNLTPLMIGIITSPFITRPNGNKILRPKSARHKLKRIRYR